MTSRETQSPVWIMGLASFAVVWRGFSSREAEPISSARLPICPTCWRKLNRISSLRKTCRLLSGGNWSPGLLINATLPRWWDVSQGELHAVALYQRSGEELLTASVGDEQLRAKVMIILSDRMDPEVSARVERAMIAGRLSDADSQITPADTFYLAVEYRRRFPTETISPGPASQELETMSRGDPAQLNWDRLSQDFGVPHPILAQSYSKELLNLKPFPAFEGYSSRLLAETWDSNNLYWARLADEKGYPPVMLNSLVPQLTHRMVEKIFASDFEDWPAMNRAMKETGEEFRQGKIASLSLSGGANQP